MGKRIVQTRKDTKKIKYQEYKQGEFQAIWDYLDSLNKNIKTLKAENKKLKNKLKGDN